MLSLLLRSLTLFVSAACFGIGVALANRAIWLTSPEGHAKFAHVAHWRYDLFAACLILIICLLLLAWYRLLRRAILMR